MARSRGGGLCRDESRHRSGWLLLPRFLCSESAPISKAPHARMIVLARRTPPRHRGSTGTTTSICQTIASVATCMRPPCIDGEGARIPCSNYRSPDTPVSGSRADSAPHLRHSRILSVKPQPTSSVSAKSIQRGDPTWVQQENVPQGNALQVDGSKPTDAVATSSPAAAKPIEQSDAPSIPQLNDSQGRTLQVGI
jgi:hypothetical protein